MAQVITVAQQKGGAGKTTVAATLAVEAQRRGLRVALLDTDPQGSLGRWFLARRQRPDGPGPGLDFSTASAWGVSYECEKLRRTADLVIIDTPPKADADLRPALREADLVLVPVAASMMDLWAVDGVLDLVNREGRRALIVLNRIRSGARLTAEVAQAAEHIGGVASARLCARQAYAEALGQGGGVSERRGPAALEAAALTDEILAVLAI